MLCSNFQEIWTELGYAIKKLLQYRNIALSLIYVFNTQYIIRPICLLHNISAAQYKGLIETVL